jgi:hypothetical protein
MHGHGFNSKRLDEILGTFFATHLLGKEAELKEEVIPLQN